LIDANSLNSNSSTLFLFSLKHGNSRLLYETVAGAEPSAL